MIISLAIVLDGLITYFIPGYYFNIDLLYPMLTVSLIPFLYSNNYKKYFTIIFITGFIYDLLYSNLFLYNTILFLLLAHIDIKLIKYFKGKLLFYLLLIIINIIIYDLAGFIIVYFTNYQDITIFHLLYKLKNSFLLNIMSGFVYYFWFMKKRNIHKM